MVHNKILESHRRHEAMFGFHWIWQCFLRHWNVETQSLSSPLRAPDMCPSCVCSFPCSICCSYIEFRLVQRKSRSFYETLVIRCSHKYLSLGGWNKKGWLPSAKSVQWHILHAPSSLFFTNNPGHMGPCRRLISREGHGFVIVSLRTMKSGVRSEYFPRNSTPVNFIHQITSHRRNLGTLFK